MRVRGSRLLSFIKIAQIFGGISLGTALLFHNALAENSLESIQALTQAGKAEEAYQLLLQRPTGDALGFYNLGTLAFRAGHMGAAIGYLEKARRLRPHDPDIRHNLDIARTSLSRTLGSADRLDPASSWSEKLAENVSLEELRGVLGLLILALFLLWTRTYIRSRQIKACFSGFSSTLGMLTVLLVTSLYFVERNADDRPPAIALGRLSIRSGPGPAFPELTEVDPGVKLRVVGRSDQTPNLTAPHPENGLVPSLIGSPESSSATSSMKESSAPSERWFQVRYSSEEIGWVAASSVMVID